MNKSKDLQPINLVRREEQVGLGLVVGIGAPEGMIKVTLADRLKVLKLFSWKMIQGFLRVCILWNSSWLVQRRKKLSFFI